MDSGTTDRMTLEVLLPDRVFCQVGGVVRLVAETTDGSYGFLPHRLDCVAALVPGILFYETEGGKLHYLAVHEGMLVKCGSSITVSVHNALGDVPLGQLHEAVKKEFVELDETQRKIRSVIAKMERNFVLSIEKFRSQ